MGLEPTTLCMAVLADRLAAAAAAAPIAAATSAAGSRPAAVGSAWVGLRLDVSCGIVVRGRGYHTSCSRAVFGTGRLAAEERSNAIDDPHTRNLLSRDRETPS
jgi:hypothetical protein